MDPASARCSFAHSSFLCCILLLPGAGGLQCSVALANRSENRRNRKTSETQALTRDYRQVHTIAGICDRLHDDDGKVSDTGLQDLFIFSASNTRGDVHINVGYDFTWCRSEEDTRTD